MKNKNITILIDAGHGEETPGKRSPDGRLREYAYCREIVQMVVENLTNLGYDARELTPEKTDVSLKERVRRANEICNIRGAGNVILISIHCNAAGSGKEWMKARGWEAWTSPGQTAGDLLAEALYQAAGELLPEVLPIRKDITDGDSDKEARFAILTGTRCGAVLTENLFQDNLEDVEFMLSPAGKRCIADLHVRGIEIFLVN